MKKLLPLTTAAVVAAATALILGPATPGAQAEQEQPAQALPRIEAVTPAGSRLGYLRRADTNERFTPRGANYVRLASFQLNGTTREHHATFEPGLYDAKRAESTLAQLQHDGYNTVRVFIDPGDIPAADAGHPHGLGRGRTDTNPVHVPYMVNVGDFVKKATKHGIYVQFALDAFPQNLYYHRQTGPIDTTQIAGNNLYYLHAGMQKAKASYLTNFVTALKDQVGEAGLSGVLGYATDNEAFVVGDQPPFSKGSGKVATADGLSYDMAVPKERQQAQDANLVVYANRMQAAVKQADPLAMTTMGAFTYSAVGKTGPAGLPLRCEASPCSSADYRYPVRLASLTTWAKLPYVDLHIYPDGTAGSLKQNLDSIEWSQVKGPVVLGEFGAFKAAYGNDITRAAYAMRDLQRQTCAAGMSGWFFWTWDTTETADQLRLFTQSEKSGAINGQLAPIVRPNPCS